MNEIQNLVSYEFKNYVERYNNERNKAIDYLEGKDISVSIQVACMPLSREGLSLFSFKKGHFWCISKKALKQMSEYLTKRAKEINEANTFETIYNIVIENNINGKPIKGIGNGLIAYDIAIILGLKKDLYPTSHVYFHRGAKAGYEIYLKKAGNDTKVKKVVEVANLALPFHKHTNINTDINTDIIESFSCVYLLHSLII